MGRIILSTGNIVSGGPSIIRKPGTYRSNLELTNSLRSNFLAAQEDYSSTPSANTLDDAGADGFDDPHRADLKIWTEQASDTLYVPRIDWSTAGLQEDRPQYEITLKLFFLPTAPADQRAEYLDTALRLVNQELNIGDIDLLIATFPGMAFEGDCEWEADKRNALMGNDAEELATWKMLEKLHGQGLVHRLGIAEFGTEKLARFVQQVRVRPAVNQINIRNCCNVPPPLAALVKEHDIELLTHGDCDCADILPTDTLRDLLGSGLQGAGLLGGDLEGGEEPRPLWVAKYTAFVKDRGVIENKGYFAGAEFVGR